MIRPVTIAILTAFYGQCATFKREALWLLLPSAMSLVVHIYVALFLVTTCAYAVSFHIADKFQGPDFLTWDFQTFDDPTHGRVNYVDKDTALQTNLSFGVLNRLSRKGGILILLQCPMIGLSCAPTPIKWSLLMLAEETVSESRLLPLITKHSSSSTCSICPKDVVHGQHSGQSAEMGRGLTAVR